MAAKIVSLGSLVAQFELDKRVLVSSNRRLVEKNSELERQRRSTRKLLAQHRTRTVNSGIERAAKRIARAGAAMIPVVGISSLAAATASEIQDLCSDIEAVRELELSLYGGESSASVTANGDCHQQLVEELAEYTNGLRQQMLEMSARLADVQYRKAIEKQYKEMVDFWSQRLAELSDDQTEEPGSSLISDQIGDPM